jgi:Putative peptidoglycan binding domain
MTLPQTPNRSIPESLRKGDEGWPVYGLQSGLDALNYNLTYDGDFGVRTDQAVREFQIKQKLGVDGIAGQATQLRIISLIDAKTHDKFDSLPAGLLRGFSEAEGGNNLGAVNWNIKGGVDCGVVQVRCYGPPFKSNEMYVAYDPSMAMERIGHNFMGRLNDFRQMPYAKTHSVQFAQRCAALSWNWPWGAEELARNGRFPNPNKDATWAVINGKRIKFPDGAPVMTYKDWSEFYAMGGKHGEGRVTKYVRW